MPRTRQVKKQDEPKESLPAHKSAVDSKFYEKAKEIYIRKREELVKQKELVIGNFRLQSKQNRLVIPISVGNRKLKDLRQSNNWHTISSVKQCSVLSSILQHGGSELSKKKTSDDGYLTSDSATETSGGIRKSRSTRRVNSTSRGEPIRRSSRTSRSLSRNMNLAVCSTVKKSTRKSRSVSRASTRSRFKTPLNNKKLENFGMVTPKMKPNTPSVVLRRPGQGEIAISLRGSPLMTTAMVSETTANVNIPLADGRMINIQPMKGLRASEIPELDPEIQKQLRTLRDNLDKVCQMSKMK
ncbi:borealin isoform X1 [Coccinella septempunctata]|uniref:borealin isoform X1 n=1 Tax=Coccinella septempunctata TaxID=41139 RepID=UPI001D07445F|nr:borealin isoform X1 [Coccinella septempunctata]